MHAVIVPQGKHGETCKQLTKFAATDKQGNVSFPPIKFPCLRVELDSNGNKFAITWSHFYHVVTLGPDKGQPITSEHPGKFKLKHIAPRRPFLYERDTNGRIVNDSRSRPMFDFMTMARDWGTEATYQRGQYTWAFGDNHPMIEEIIWEEEYETLDALNEAIATRFDSDLADAVCVEFMSHELYQTYDTTCMTPA